jgi:hypothetical protein
MQAVSWDSACAVVLPVDVSRFRPLPPESLQCAEVDHRSSPFPVDEGEGNAGIRMSIRRTSTSDMRCPGGPSPRGGPRASVLLVCVAGGVLLGAAACGRADAPAPVAPQPPPALSRDSAWLATTLRDRIAAVAGAEVSVAVRDLLTGRGFALGGDR